MKKIIIVAVVICSLLSAYLGSAWYSGRQISEYLQASLLHINAIGDSPTSSITVKVSELSYEPGFFSSKVKYGISVNPSKYDKSKKAKYFELEGVVKHGPFPLLQEGNLAPKMAAIDLQFLKTDDIALWFDLTKGESPIKLQQAINYGSTSSVNLELTPFNYEKDGLEFRFSGLDLNSNIDVTQENEVKAIANGNINSFEILVGKGMMFKFAINDIAFNLNNVFIVDKSIITGFNSVEIKSLKGIAPLSGIVAEAYNLKFDGDASLTNNKLAYKTTNKIGQLKVNEQNFGGGEFNISLDNIDFTAFKEFENLIAHNFENHEDFKKQQQVLINNTFALNPSISFNPVSWRTDKGQGKIVAKATFQSTPNLDGVKNIFQDYKSKVKEDLIKSVNFDAQVSIAMLKDLATKIFLVLEIPEDEAIKTAEQKVDEFIAGLDSKIVVQENDNLSQQLNYADGVFTLNGQVVNLDEL